VDPTVLGRDAEIAEIAAFLSATSGTPAALVITGEPGIGKTAVWRQVTAGAAGSSRVLCCQPAVAERPLAFAALDDLLGDLIEEVLPALPGPRRRAVENMLLRDVSLPQPAADGDGGPGRQPPTERRALVRGVLDALRVISADAPLVLAVDDAQWLDRPSAAVLEFCVRRLQREPISILLTVRTGDPVPLGLDRVLPPSRLRGMRLGPLSLRVIGEILRSRLGRALPRHALTRLYDASGGNPYYAIECARLLVDRPYLAPTNEPVPVPHTLSDLVRHRVRRLSPEVRRVSWLVAASPLPRERAIRSACDGGESWAAIDQAIDDGVLERSGDLLRFTHPLLRSVLYAEMTSSQRREAHWRLVTTAENAEEHAWHLALAADRPSEQTAALLDAAAAHAAARGAPEEAAALAEQAARLTPADRYDAARERTVRAADYYFRAGNMTRSRDLIDAALAACPVGQRQAPLLVRLAAIHYHQSGWPLAERALRQAADQARDDPALCAHAEQEIAFARLVAGDLPAACRWARTSLRSAKRAADPRLTARSLAGIALFEFLRGHGARAGILQRAEALAAAAGQEPIARMPMLDPALVTGMVLKWCDRLDEARLKLANRYQHALDRGDEASLPFLLYHFSQLECWAGNWNTAEEYALEACRVADESQQLPMKPAALYSLALVRAHRGQVAEARELAGEALVLSERTGNIPVTSMAVSVLGFIALSLDDHQATHAHLGRLADATAATGLGEPSVVKFLPDEIEALAALGLLDTARSLTERLEARGRSLGRPWALAAGARCRALLAAKDGLSQDAQAACEQALSQHESLPMPFELGRTLLVKGMIEQRTQRRLAARKTLGHALGIFEQLGAPLWAAKASRELAKVSAQITTEGLTLTEHRLATLVAQGLTNRQVAALMFVSENTVQTHIKNIFRKLGVRSRTELAARVLSAPTGSVTSAKAVTQDDGDALSMQ
jgi:DNA-binding CsgD family transcriptional regulator/tetratricopeptide (TPR) repeat protein